MKELKYMLLGIPFGLLIYFGFFYKPLTLKEELEEAKKELLKKDSLIKVKEGHYTKLVNDMHTSESILNQLKEDNRELYESLKNKKPIITTQTIIKPIIKKDTVRLKDTLIVDNFFKKLESYYPSKEDYFIKYRAIMDSSRVREEWRFKEFPINLSIVEKQKGLYEATINGPKWLTVNKLKVNSLPLSPVQDKKRRYLLGTGMEYDIRTKNMTQYFQTGIIINNYSYVIGFNLDGVLKLGVNKYF